MYSNPEDDHDSLEDAQDAHVPRFILPDYMVHMRLKEIETAIAEGDAKDSLLIECLDCQEHLRFQERLRKTHAKTNAISSFAFMLHGLMTTSDHTFAVDQDWKLRRSHDWRLRHSNDYDAARKRIILPQPEQIIGNMKNAVDKVGVDPSEVRRPESLMYLAGEIVKPDFDATSKQVYENTQAVYQYFREVHERDSINDKHLKLVSSVHFGHQYANAFWSPVNLQMIYGDGNPSFMTNIAESLDIIGHEITHGIIDQECNLKCEGESGALNESISDVFAILIKQWKNNQTVSQSDWIIGEGTVPQWGNGLRSFKLERANRFDIQPKTYADIPQCKEKYAEEFQMDHEGENILSGIPNNAFYRFCTSFKQGGFRAYDGLPAKIWYDVVVGDDIKSDTNFHQFAALTLKKSLELGGKEVAQNLYQSWADVGIILTERDSKACCEIATAHSQHP